MAPCAPADTRPHLWCLYARGGVDCHGDAIGFDDLRGRQYGLQEEMKAVGSWFGSRFKLKFDCGNGGGTSYRVCTRTTWHLPQMMTSARIRPDNDNDKIFEWRWGSGRPGDESMSIDCRYGRANTAYTTGY